MTAASRSLVLASSFPDYTGVAVIGLAVVAAAAIGVLLMVANLLRSWVWAQVLGALIGGSVSLVAVLFGLGLGSRMSAAGTVMVVFFFLVGAAQIVAVPLGRHLRRRRAKRGGDGPR